jgi:YggT family protein
MNAVLQAFDLVLALARPVLFVGAVVLGGAALVDWLVRTRRIPPFSPVARIARDSLAPLFKPMERRIVRGGGNPQSAPWFTLAAVVLGGIVLLSLLQFVRDQLLFGMAAAAGGGRGVIMVLLQWTFLLLRTALIVRVVSSWFQVSPYSKWVRWAFSLSEPILGPLRQVIPPLGMMDISPIVAFFALSLLEGLVMSLVR